MCMWRIIFLRKLTQIFSKIVNRSIKMRKGYQLRLRAVKMEPEGANKIYGSTTENKQVFWRFMKHFKLEKRKPNIIKLINRKCFDEILWFMTSLEMMTKYPPISAAWSRPTYHKRTKISCPPSPPLPHPPPPNWKKKNFLWTSQQKSSNLLRQPD